ncbi:hypothetical protein [Amycolatopsis orientalis]|uniref:hypothetical protein n=1 Tax=Amycolatopsis orientalis TaxID=31958 RepID=UPI0004113A12|nr:hypothetical protein [Amycolatopsis orientalis]
MTNDFDLPPDRPMPDHLRNALWNRIVPDLAAPAGGARLKKVGKPLAVAAVVVGLAAGAAVVFAPVRDAGPSSVPAPAGPGSGSPARHMPSSPEDVELARECIADPISYGLAVPEPDSWWPAVKIDTDTPQGFLVIRNEKAAAVCILSGGKVRMMGADVEEMAGRRGGYAKLTPEFPCHEFTSIGGGGGPTSLFGIASDDVTAVSLVGPDNSTIPASLRDGTFAVTVNDARVNDPHGGFRYRATLKNGHVIDVSRNAR